jgi:hypothetical protein
MSSSGGTYVAKRFLAGMNDDYVNADHIVRLYWSTGKLMADMGIGPPIHLKTRAPVTSPGLTENPMLHVEMVSL